MSLDSLFECTIRIIFYGSGKYSEFFPVHHIIPLLFSDSSTQFLIKLFNTNIAGSDPDEMLPASRVSDKSPTIYGDSLVHFDSNV